MSAKSSSRGDEPVQSSRFGCFGSVRASQTHLQPGAEHEDGQETSVSICPSVPLPGCGE